MLIADLHIHSHYSRATSGQCIPEYLDLWARRKGIGLVGTGDFTHPAWREELYEKLTSAEAGLYRLRKAYRMEEELPDACTPRFIVTGEISSIYKKNGRVRKVHNLILLPSLDAAERIAKRLEEVGNIHSDGRPILGVDSRDLAEIVLDASPDAVFIPAHIWTPHFSLFGAFSGFDTMEECFEDMTPHIHAVETGLSSDPPMNWRLSALDGYTLVSNSDAHSPGKLGREANLLDTELSYLAVARALTQPDAAGFCGTIEFFPEEGKYHLDGHRKCSLCLEPAETRAANGVCPVCGGRLTIGVLHRVEQMADRAEGYTPPNAPRFESLIPLPEVIARPQDGRPRVKRWRRNMRRCCIRLARSFSFCARRMTACCGKRRRLISTICCWKRSPCMLRTGLCLFPAFLICWSMSFRISAPCSLRWSKHGAIGRRLLYVGMTRAQEKLILLTSGEPSPFLRELPAGQDDARAGAAGRQADEPVPLNWRTRCPPVLHRENGSRAETRPFFSLLFCHGRPFPFIRMKHMEKRGTDMFAALTKREPPHGLLRRVRFRLAPPAPGPRRMEVPGGGLFFVLEASFFHGHPRWRAVERAAGACAGRMLFPTGLEPPADSGLSRFIPKELPPLTLFASFLGLLGGRRVVFPFSVTLYDPCGALLAQIGRLVGHVSLVRVVTDREEAYRAAAERMMEEYGAALLVTDDRTVLADAPLVLAPFGLPDAFPAPRGLTVAPTGGGGEETLAPSGLSLPAPYCALLPAGIEAEDFGAALYELCGVRALADAPCAGWMRGRTVLTQKEASALLDSRGFHTAAGCVPSRSV